MGKLIEFVQSLGPAEFIITVLLVAACLIAYYDCKSIDRKHDADKKRFDEKYPR